MSFDAHKNFAYSTVRVAPTPAASGTTLSLQVGDGAKMPAAPFNMTVWPAGALALASNAEIVRVTAISGDDLTITRAQEGSSAQAVAVGFQIAATITAKTITDIEAATGSALSFANSNGVTFGSAGGTVTASVATNYQSQGAYLTTAMPLGAVTMFVQNNAIFHGTNASGTIASDGISVSVAAAQPPGAYLTTAMLSNASTAFAATGFTTTTAAGANVAGTHDTAGLKLAVPAYLTTAQPPGAYLTTAQPVGAYLTTAMLSNASSVFGGTGFTTTTVAGAAIAGTNNTAGLLLGVPAFLTTAQAPGAYLTTAALSGDSSKYAGTNASMVGGSITLNTSGATISLPAYLTTAQSPGAYLTTAMLSNAVTLSNVNISAGTLSQNLSAWNYSNSNGYSFGLSASTITMQGPYVGFLEPLPMTNTALFGPAAGSWYFAPFVAPNSMSGGRINLLHQNTSTAGLFQDITGASYVSASTGTLNQSYTYSKAIALYSQGAGTNSTRLESFWSNSFSFGWSKQVQVALSQATNINISVAHTISYISEVGSNGSYTLTNYNNSTATVVANSSTASNQYTNVASSIRNMLSNSIIEPIGFNTTISAGAYWLAFAWSTTRASAGTGGQLASALDFSVSSEVGISRLVLESAYRNWGSTATTARSHLMPYGVYTGAANMAPPSTLAFSSDLSSLASAWVPYFNFQLQGITK